MAGSHTIVSGSTVSAGYTIPSSSFTLLVDGVAGSTSAKYGVLSNSTLDTITNAGKVFGLLSGGNGIELNDGGLITNNSGATISGSYAGIMGQTDAVTLSNQGTVTGVTAGVWLKAGGSISNAATISGNYDVIIGGGAGTVHNTGHIDGGKLAIGISDGGSVYNAAGATITANAGGKALYILNAGGAVLNPSYSPYVTATDTLRARNT